MRKYDADAFSMNVPEAWLDKSTFVIADDGSGPFRPSVVVTFENVPENVTAEDYCKKHLEAMKASFNAFESVEPPTPAKLGKHDALRHVFKWRNDRGDHLQQCQYYARTENRVYTVTFTHRADRFEKHREVFDEIAAAFKVKTS